MTYYFAVEQIGMKLRASCSALVYRKVSRTVSAISVKVLELFISAVLICIFRTCSLWDLVLLGLGVGTLPISGKCSLSVILQFSHFL